jgi:tetratricopeptide (TPR) repeat protein
MKRIAVLFFAIAFTSFGVAGQKIDKPTITPKPCSDTENIAIAAGTKFHDARRYDEAIAAYQDVLKSNPECTLAMYELSFSYYAKGDKLKAAETASLGTKYISDEIPLFYLTLANVMDDAGKPDEAIKIYDQAIKFLKDNPLTRKYLSSLYYNLGVTYTSQKKYLDARQALRNAVENDFSYASPHYLLSVVFDRTGYRIPALLAAVRLVSLEYDTNRTATAVNVIANAFSAAKKDPTSGNINIFVNMNAPKDEGDFAMFDLILGTATTVRGDKDKDKTDNEMFIKGMDTVFAIFDENKALKTTFVGKNYGPFIADMRKAGYLPVFGNIVLFLHDHNNVEAKDWLDKNGPQVNSFFAWAKAYGQSNGR